MARSQGDPQLASLVTRPTAGGGASRAAGLRGLLPAPASVTPIPAPEPAPVEPPAETVEAPPDEPRAIAAPEAGSTRRKAGSGEPANRAAAQAASPVKTVPTRI